MEELNTEERDVVVRISSLGEEGSVKGNLEVQETGEFVYKNLLKEGVIQLHIVQRSTYASVIKSCRDFCDYSALLFIIFSYL